jgi:hypothetical protein
LPTLPKVKPAPDRPLSYLLYIGVAFLAFAPGFLSGRAYCCNDLLQIFAEVDSFLKDQLARGHFPLWDPYLFGGQPFFADPNTTMCYPPHYFRLLFPLPLGFSVFFFIHMALAAAGMHFWLRGSGLSSGASRVGALLFSLSGFFWWQLLSPPLLSSFSWAPWFLGCLERAFREGGPKWAFLTGLCFAVIFCCGHVQSATYLLYGASAYGLFLLWRKGRTEGRGALSWKRSALFLLLAAWGSLPMLVQFVPAVEFFHRSFRSNPLLDYDHFNATFSMPPRSLPQFLFPRMGSAPGTRLEEGIVSFADDDRYKDNPDFGVMGYLGVWAPFLMLLAFRGGARETSLWMGLLCLAGVLSACGHYLPFHAWECRFLPGIGLSRAPNRWLEVYALFASALAARGYEGLRQGTPRSRKGLLILSGLYGSALLFLSLREPSNNWPESAALVYGMVGLGLGSWDGRRGSWGRGLFLAALVVPLMVNGWMGFSTGPWSNYDFEGNFPAFRYLEQKGALGRYLFDPDLDYRTVNGGRPFLQPLPRNAPLDFRIRSTGGNEGFFLQKTFDLTRLPGVVFAKLLAVKGLVWEHPIPGAAAVVRHSFPGAEVYEPLAPPPYLNTPSVAKVAADDAESLRLMASAGFDPSREVVLSSPLPYGMAARLSPFPAALAYSLERDDPDDQVFLVRLDKNSLVVFSEVMYPGWKAWIDGKRAEVLTGDHAFRTLLIPAGGHRVEFRFEPSWVQPLEFGLLAWLLSILAYGRFKGWTRPSRAPKIGHA